MNHFSSVLERDHQLTVSLSEENALYQPLFDEQAELVTGGLTIIKSQTNNKFKGDVFQTSIKFRDLNIKF